jgi:hypothetical protein
MDGNILSGRKRAESQSDSQRKRKLLS